MKRASGFLEGGEVARWLAGLQRSRPFRKCSQRGRASPREFTGRNVYRPLRLVITPQSIIGFPATSDALSMQKNTPGKSAECICKTSICPDTCAGKSFAMCVTNKNFVGNSCHKTTTATQTFFAQFRTMFASEIIKSFSPLACPPIQ